MTATLTGGDLIGYSLTEDVGAGFAYLSFQDGVAVQLTRSVSFRSRFVSPPLTIASWGM